MQNAECKMQNWWKLHSAFCIHHSAFFCDTRAAKSEAAMDDIERNDNGAEDDDQFEQMIIENSILLHSLAALLVRKGVLKQEEVDAEMDKLYDEMEKFDEE